MTKKDFIRVTTCAAIFGLVGGVTFEGTNYIYNKNFAVESSKETDSEAKSPVVTSTSTGNGASAGSVSEVAENVLPSIVAIDVTVTKEANDMFGRTYSQDAQGSGSGIVVAQDENNLYIATNNHVVSDASKVSVKFNDESVYSAQVKGTDADCDLAVVTIPVKDLSSDTLSKIKVATLGDSEKVKVGDQAIAIGNALGYGTSVTVGYISAKEREVSAEDMTMKLIQTDAAINPGNSGGALVDASGAVIGINSAKYADESVEGMGFAIPVSKAVPIINEIIKSEKVSEEDQAYLGIRGRDVEKEYTSSYNIPQGIFVSEVSEDSPAMKAGMLQGDIITEFNGREVATMDSLAEKLGKLKAGTKIKVVVKRANNGEYQEKTLTVTLGKKSDAMDDEDDASEQQDNSQSVNPFQNGQGGRSFFGN